MKSHLTVPEVSTALLLGALAAGCGSSARPADPDVPLCDGRDGLTLRVSVESGGLEQLGGAVRVENGYPSFAVDGQCRYYISGGWQGERMGRDLGWRQGALDASSMLALERVAGWDDLSLAIGDCRGPQVSDGSSLFIGNTRSALMCSRAGDADDVFYAVRAVALGLWERGLPLDQGLHINAIDLGQAPEEPLYDWPSAPSLTDLLPDTPAYEVRALVAASEASPLRELREHYLRDVPAMSYRGGNGIFVTDGESKTTIFMRDALPYEDERGLWPRLGE